MRRGLAVFILGFSLFLGSLAWTAFIVTNTVLDPGRSERVAQNLLDDDQVRAQITENMADALVAAVPPEVGVDRDDAAAATENLLDSPAVEAVVFGALVDAHRALLGEGDAPESVTSDAFGDAARDELVDERPDLAQFLPAVGPLDVDLPTRGIPNLGPVRDALTTAVPVLAGLAALGIVLALVVTTNRPAVLRRTGFWAIGLAAAVLALAFGIPAFADQFFTDQAAIVRALVDALSATTRVPAVGLAAAGVVCLIVSFLWRPAAAAATPAPAPAPGRAPRNLPPAMPRTGHRRGERARRRDGAPAPAAPPAPAAARRAAPTPAPTATPRPAPATSPAPNPATRAVPTGTPPPRTAPPARGPSPAGPPQWTPPRGQPAAPPPTAATPAATSAPTPPPAPSEPTQVTPAAPDPRPDSRPGARRVDGVGWVHEGDGPIPDRARFVPGVGYVLPD